MLLAEESRPPRATSRRSLQVGQFYFGGLPRKVGQFKTGVDMLNCIGWLVTVCWILGYPDQSWHQAQHLAELLRQPLPPNAYWTGMHHLVTMHCDFVRDYQGARAGA
jgi:hypothetical protein